VSTGTTKAPALPLAPVQYDRQYQDSLNNILRQYFQQLDNPGPCAASTQKITVPSGTEIISAQNYSTVNQATQTRVVSLPTQADLANLRVGDLYYDTTAGNVVKIKV
jgi:hypothetical protein